MIRVWFASARFSASVLGSASRETSMPSSNGQGDRTIADRSGQWEQDHGVPLARRAKERKRAPRVAVPNGALLVRDTEAAILLSVSTSQIQIWARSGLLHPVKIPGIRATRFSRAEVEALAHRWCAEAGAQDKSPSTPARARARERNDYGTDDAIVHQP